MKTQANVTKDAIEYLLNHSFNKIACRSVRVHLHSHIIWVIQIEYNNWPQKNEGKLIVLYFFIAQSCALRSGPEAARECSRQALPNILYMTKVQQALVR